MSTGGDILFLLCAIVGVVSSIMTVTSKSPLRAAMALLLHIFSLAGLFLTLHAHMLAAIQLLVYAGAVVVLFVFVIMLIGPSAEEDKPKETGGFTRTFGLLFMATVTMLMAFSLSQIGSEWTTIAGCDPMAGAECGQFGGVGALSKALFKEAVVPFELVSVLLLVAIVGAIGVARARSEQETAEVKAWREQVKAKEAALREEEQGAASA